MWWRKKPEKPLRQQLLEAQASLRRQIEIMGASTVAGYGYQPGSKEELEDELRQIEDALANLGPEEG